MPETPRCPLLERLSLPIRLPFVLGAKSGWLQHQRVKGAWEILLVWKIEGETYHTWVGYSPEHEAAWSEDVELIVLIDTVRPVRTTQDLRDYITWVYAGRPTEEAA